jgi:hypothetical protein
VWIFLPELSLMNVTFACPRCHETGAASFADNATLIDCSQCHAVLPAPSDAWSNSELHRCLVCGSDDLFVRKDFPQRLGLAIVVIGFGLSCVTWYFYWTYLTFAVLSATALADMGLFFLVGESLVCYRCHAEYRELASMTEHGPFNLETHEKYRQQAARLAQPSSAVARATAEVHSPPDSPDH